MPIRIQHLFISSGHNFFGHHGRPPGTHPMEARSGIRCLAGRGIEGDRFLDFKPGYKGQITFFESEVFHELRDTLGLPDQSPAAFRRNVITEGAALSSLIGRRFEIQGVAFLGKAECAPCSWMENAFGPGAEALLKGRGGLRAVILSDGWLRTESAAL